MEAVRQLLSVLYDMLGDTLAKSDWEFMHRHRDLNFATGSCPLGRRGEVTSTIHCHQNAKFVKMLVFRSCKLKVSEI